MSDFNAIAGVSRTVRTLLRDRMASPPANITVAPPDVGVTGATGRRLNLYLFHLSENSSLKNQEIPGRGHPGAFGHPPLSLNLHYLITAYGESEITPDADLDAQELLADAMRVLHDFPIIAEGLLITDPASLDVGNPVLDGSLLGEFETIKLTLQSSTVEDYVRLWTALPQSSFRRSVIYQASVVQIESQRARSFPRPVGEPAAAGPRIYALPFRSVQIEEIRVRRPGDPPALERAFSYASIGDTLIIRGRNLVGDATRVLLGDLDVTAGVTVASPERIETALPDDPVLQPGVHPLVVVRDLLMGNPLVRHRGFRSNAAPFMLVPRITALAPNLAAVPRTLQIAGTRLFEANFDCLALVGDAVIAAADYTAAASTSISFNLPASLGTGDHAVRVRVNGAENLVPLVLNIP